MVAVLTLRRSWDRVGDVGDVSIGSKKSRGTRVFLPLGARGTPPTHKLRLVRTTRPPRGDLEVVGFAFNPCPTRDENAAGF